MKKIILLSVAIMLVQLAFSQSFYPKLQILNPKAQWQADIASITEAQIFVRPKGVYMEYNIYMTYAATNTSLNKTSDTTEIVHFFNLPSKAIVTDSWLWVNDVIVKADLIDKWAATQIYEGIVKRNQDPSILTKTGPIDYQFRIFPLPGGKTRKVKITVLVPIDFSNDKVIATLPLNLFSLSKIQLKKFMLVFPEMNGWESPALSEKSNLVYKTETDPTFGKYTSTEVPYNKENSMTVTFKNPMTDGVYVANYKAGKENFYAMALQPSKIYSVSNNAKKITFAIAHDDFETSTKWTESINTLKQHILKSLNAKDSFNIIYNDLLAVKYSNQWVSASPQNVEAAINSLLPKVPFEANLSGVLGEALSWNKSNKGNAIVLLAATDTYTAISKANALIKVLESQYPAMPTIHIADYNNSNNAAYTWSNGTYYFGNEYLYTYLTQKTGGNYSSWRETNGLYSYTTTKNLTQSLAEVMSGLFDNVKNLDLYTTLEDGYCHSRYNINTNNNSFYNNTIVQSGKYEGNFPLNIQIAGTVGEVSFFKKYSIPETKIVAVDSTIKQIWTGAYLADNEFKAISNATIKDLLTISKKNRVLSQYTAFLALEPGMNQVQPCSTCTDETTIVTATEESEKDSLIIKVFPNPFRDKVTIEISATNTSETEIKVAIFNLTGQIVHQATLPIDDKKASLTWEADNIQNGMYIAQIQIGTKKYNVKLLKME